MPFYYDMCLPEDLSSCRLIERLVLAGTYIQPNTAIARLGSERGQLLLRNTGRGVLRQWFVEEGHAVVARQAITRMNADGEDIPYGRPYAILDVVNGGDNGSS